ncbi:hypothetical protein [Micromonospora sp. NPDC049374]|uniref:hypothetical protein n=1 Tax=Micromonospora sp. NPDC049374 TaxID=3154352 RepID=UPI0034385C64
MTLRFVTWNIKTGGIDRGRVDRTGQHRHRAHGPGGRRHVAHPADGCVAWTSSAGQDLDATALMRALGTWFGRPA